MDYHSMSLLTRDRDADFEKKTRVMWIIHPR